MVKKISKTAEIEARLQREGKVAELNQKQHKEAIYAMNQSMEAVRREFQVKERNSQLAASDVILTK